MVGRGS